MANQREPQGQPNVKIRDLLRADYQAHIDGAPSITIETDAGEPWVVYTGPYSMHVFREVLRLCGLQPGQSMDQLQGELPIENAIGAVILLARNADGKPMFTKADAKWLENEARPRLLLQEALPWLVEQLQLQTAEAEEAAEKN